MIKPHLTLNLLLLALLLFARPVLGGPKCNLSQSPGLAGACPAGAVGKASFNPDWTEGLVDPQTNAKTAIDAFGYCRYVGNSGDTQQFVPFGDPEEWYAYLTNHPKSVYFVQCTRGGLLPMPPNFGSVGSSNQCVILPPVQTIFVPYKPATLPGPFTAPPVTYICKSADGTEFTETATATLDSHDSGYGPNDDIGWKFSKILYTYDGVCGAAKGIEAKTPPTTGLCSVGVASMVMGTGPFQWICASGNGGGKNITCNSGGAPCETRKVDEKPCRCENKDCYRPVYWQDSCGHSWIDKSQKCDTPEPNFKPDGPADYDNDFLSHSK